MAKTIGLAILGLADALTAWRPDLLLLIADRYEMLAPASVALALRIPIAHIEGGEVSQGAIDDHVRNALTKLAHIHFTSTETARRRVIAMGEEPWRVHRAGAPSLDHLRRSTLLDRAALEARLGITLRARPRSSPPGIPSPSFATPTPKPMPSSPRSPRPPASSSSSIPTPTPAATRSSNAPRLSPPRAPTPTSSSTSTPSPTGACSARSTAMVGNSSSGIMEAASFALPVVNVGMRQQGRERARNILDAPAETAAILAAIQRALSPAFRAGLAGMANPYGDGTAAATIARVLTTVPLEGLLVKQPAPVPRPRSSHDAEHPPLRARHHRSRNRGRHRRPAHAAPQPGPRTPAFEAALAAYHCRRPRRGRQLRHRRTASRPPHPRHRRGRRSHRALLRLRRRRQRRPPGPRHPRLCGNRSRHPQSLDPAAVEQAITPRTRAILAVHTFGVPAEMDALQAIARRHHLVLIEDACEAIGAEFGGQRAGTFGDLAVFGFYPNKQITTGEGGAVLARDPAPRSPPPRSLRNQGRLPSAGWLDHAEIGYNYRLSDLACALGRVQLSRIDEILALRRAAAERYHALLSEIPGLELPPLTLPRRAISWFVYVVRLPRTR